MRQLQLQQQQTHPFLLRPTCGMLVEECSTVTCFAKSSCKPAGKARAQNMAKVKVQGLVKDEKVHTRAACYLSMPGSDAERQRVQLAV